ncbi:GNAT family N-acetyltransferase [Tessaracoccus sp. ZS01]|uniref:GNAT family N-acetyltransferase n=1 Tax=Tessaracoccus sp. ZS01 TaxID=1906324 RepID=UPI00351373B1
MGPLRCVTAWHALQYVRWTYRRPMTEKATVTNNPEQNRYEIRLGDDLAGFADYILSNELITFTHTEIDPAFEGKGLGSTLVRGALDDVRGAGDRKVLPICPFVKSWMAKHPEYESLGYGS